MNIPKMILFDYGGTLIYELNFDRLRGNSALFRFIKDNPSNITPEEFTRYFSDLFDEVSALRGGRLEIHESHLLRYVLEHFGISLSVPFETAEKAMFDAITEPHEMPGAGDMLAALREKGIRTGVISNLCWSGNALGQRLNEFFPEHRFEFIMTSSEYIFRKPDTHIFDLAARKAGLSPGQIWYCGNNIEADIEGAHSAGMFPVLFDNRSVDHFEKDEKPNHNISFPHLRVSSWEEIKEHLSCIRNF